MTYGNQLKNTLYPDQSNTKNKPQKKHSKTFLEVSSIFETPKHSFHDKDCIVMVVVHTFLSVSIATIFISKR